jgi:hypothetical protein
MSIKISNGGSAKPTAFITRGKKRLKQHNKSVYLDNGDEFEIELFNPRSHKVLAKIRINGNDFGSGIVLRPGERVFLERYINEARKFVFETYRVDAKDPDVQSAIADNGEVQVHFYQETFGSPITYYNTPSYNWYPPSHPIITTTGDPGICYRSNTNMIGQSAAFSDTASLYSSTFTGHDMVSESEETGRIEKGSHSDQAFENDQSSFSSISGWNQTWKILPISKKTYVQEELVVYCTKCGAKRKKSSHIFCPLCGTRY